MQIHCHVLSMVATNCFIVKDDGGRIYIIDPADDAETIMKAVDGLGGIEPVVLLTHGHFDHIMALEQLPYPVYCHEAELDALQNPTTNGSTMIGRQFRYEKNVHLLAEGDQIGCFSVLHTPGHRPGCLCFYNAAENTLFSGDTLFCQGVGRTDLEGGSMQALRTSLKRLLALPDETKVYPGHGPMTLIADEREGLFA